MNLYIPELSGECASLLQPNENSIKPLGKIEKIYTVSVFSLSDFLDFIPFDKIDYISYLKVDVQGCDINVLKSAKNYLSEKVVYVTAEPETNQYIGSEENNIDNILNYMDNQSFININHHNTVDPTFINKKYYHLKDDIYIWQKY